MVACVCVAPSPTSIAVNALDLLLKHDAAVFADFIATRCNSDKIGASPRRLFKAHHGFIKASRTTFSPSVLFCA
jgi:hypothetical protein